MRDDPIPPLADDGRALVVAVDHPLYTYPVPGLEDPLSFVRRMRALGVDGLILNHGLLRRVDGDWGRTTPILKLDIAPMTWSDDDAVEFRVCWMVEHALKAGVGSVLCLIQPGAPWELEQLMAVGKTAADAWDNGVIMVIEALPQASRRFPDPSHPDAIAAAVRTAVELGAAVVKTNIPLDVDAAGRVAVGGVPVLFAGGPLRGNEDELIATAARLIGSGAAGLAFGRNVWGRSDPETVVRRLLAVVHGDSSADARR